MAKKIFYDDDARGRVLSGARELYEAVRVTMGPKGRNVVLSKSYGGPTVTHDGVTVAKAVDIEAVHLGPVETAWAGHFNELDLSLSLRHEQQRSRDQAGHLLELG